MPWVKAYTEMLDDTKLLRLNDACCWRFMQLILLAGVCDAEGLLTTGTGPMSLDDIAVRLRARPSRLAPQMESLISVGLIENTANGYCVVKFAERQGRKQSEKREKWNAAAAKARQNSAESGPSWNQFDANLAQNSHRSAQEVPETATKRKKSSMTHAPRVEKSREDIVGADAPSESDPVKDLSAVFTEVLKLTPEVFPKRDRFTKWWQPLQGMITLANGKAPDLLRATIQKMQRGGLTIQGPISCRAVFTDLYSQQAAAPAGPKFIEYTP